MPFSTIITTAGQAKIAAAIAGSTAITLTDFAVGDGGGTPVTPIPGMTALIHEVHRAAINRIYRDATNSALLYVELVIPSAVGGFTVREAGVFADDGTLVAVANLAETYKPLVTEGSASEMVVRTVINLGSAASVNLVISGVVVAATQDWAAGVFLAKSANLNDVQDKAVARENLGVVRAVMEAMYPIGEMLVTLRTGNPATWLGFGTWAPFAAGRALVGVDLANPAIDTAGDTTGAATVTISTSNLPAHAHPVPAQSVATTNAGTHVHTIDPPATNTANAGTHVHTIDPPATTTSESGDHAHNITSASLPVSASGQEFNITEANSGAGSPFATNSAGSHAHTVDIPPFNSAASGDHAHTVDIPPFNSAASGDHAHTVNIPGQNTQNTGGGAALNIIPPSVAVNVWKRTA